MEYIRSGNQKEYAKEGLSISTQLVRLIRNPQKKISNVYTGNYIMLVMLIAGFLFEIWFTNRCYDFINICLLGIVFLLVLLYLVRSIRFAKYVKMAVEHADENVLELDTEGATRKSTKQILKVYWNSIQCIRVCRYSFVFVAKDETTYSIQAPIENLDNVLNFLRENNISIPVYN